MSNFRDLVPGLVITGMVALAASWLAEHYSTPVMLFALLLGIAVNVLSRDERCKPGIEFASRSILRICRSGNSSADCSLVCSANSTGNSGS